MVHHWRVETMTKRVNSVYYWHWVMPKAGKVLWHSSLDVALLAEDRVDAARVDVDVVVLSAGVLLVLVAAGLGHGDDDDDGEAEDDDDGERLHG